MLDLSTLNPAGRQLYARSLAGALSAGLSPLAAEAIAKDALVKAGHVRVAKSLGEPVRVMKRIEPTKAKPELEDEIGRDNADAVRFMELYNARRNSNPKARPGEIHSGLTAEFPRLASAYRARITGR